jgi:phosphoglycerate dehydrogenase-like enzyme
MKGCFVSKENSNKLSYVFGGGRRELVEKELEIYPQVISAANLERNRMFLKQVEVILSTWNMESFSGGQIENYFPSLKAVFHAAGSVQSFARPFLERGIKVVSSWGAISVSVAELAVGLIVQANKGFFLAMSRYENGNYDDCRDLATLSFPGTYHTNVGILGAGMVGSRVIRMLKSYAVDIRVYDPFLTKEKAGLLGVKSCALEEVFAECQTISNHIADKAQTVGMLHYGLFRLMKDNAAFINTARGAQVIEADLVRALKEKPDRCAILDVTWPEPCQVDHEFRKLPNVFLTPHIAGYAAAEVWRMADYMLEELRKYKAGEQLQYEVTLPMLATMA